MAYLLDVNVLLALAWPNHLHHEAAHRWFGSHQQAGWATCPLTQLSFVRLSMQPAVVKVPLLLGDALAALARMTASPTHLFWPAERGLLDIDARIRHRIIGHQQLADAVLFDLALHHQGALATFDRRLSGLIPPELEASQPIMLIPA